MVCIFLSKTLEVHHKSLDEIYQTFMYFGNINKKKLKYTYISFCYLLLCNLRVVVGEILKEFGKSQQAYNLVNDQKRQGKGV